MNDIAGGDTLVGFAELVKLSTALLVIVVLIVVLALLLRRVRGGSMRPTTSLKVVASAAVGLKERVVIVEIQSTWLVLGVGAGQVSRLHTLPAPPPEQTPEAPTAGPAFAPGDSFATRFAKALKHNVGLR
jgi:flagellar protein FliO/FliZ